MVPVKVAVAESLATDPVAVTVFAVPLLLNVSPLPAFAVKPQDPLPEPAGETVIVHNFIEVGPVTAMLVSVDANPETVAVTVTPLGPDEGASVRLVTVPVNVAVAASLALFPVAVTVFEIPPLLNKNPFELVGANVQLPPPFVREMIVHNAVELGLVSATLVSVDANPATVAVTVTPLGPDDGLSVRLAIAPSTVNVNEFCTEFPLESPYVTVIVNVAVLVYPLGVQPNEVVLVPLGSAHPVGTDPDQVYV